MDPTYPTFNSKQVMSSCCGVVPTKASTSTIMRLRTLSGVTAALPSRMLIMRCFAVFFVTRVHGFD